MIRSTLSVLVVLLVAGAAVVAGCESLRNDASTRGRIEVRLTDTPVDGYTEVLVTINRVELLGHDADGESTLLVLADEPQVFNLLELQNGVTAPLADAEIQPGRYHQLRLVVDEQAEVVLTDGSRLTIPNAEQAGLPIAVPAFTISAGGDVARVTVDFDARDSFKHAGTGESVVFTPVIRAHSLIVNGEDVEIGAEDTPL